MRFPFIFYRGVGGGVLNPETQVLAPLLNSDVDPTDGTYMKKDNVFSFKGCNMNGFPVQRIVIGYSGPAAGLALPFKLWVWDERSSAWYQAKSTTVAPSDTSLTENQLMYVDVPTLMDNADTNANALAAGGNAGPGSIDIAIVVTTGGADPAGLYKFVVGADVSSPA